MRKKLNGTLVILAKLLEHDNVTILKLQEITRIRNWYTINRHINLLKELGLVEEEYIEGPPPRRFIRLTEKGKEVAKHAKRILELVGQLPP